MVTTPARPTPRGKAPEPNRNGSTPVRPAWDTPARPLPTTSAAPRGGSSPARAPRPGTSRSGLRRFFTEFWPRIEGSNRPSNGSSYYLILGTTLALTCIGLMMVLSSSAVESISQGVPPYDLFVRESIFGVVGVVLMLILSRFSVRRLKRLAWPAIMLSIVLLAMVFSPIGKAVNGNRNWIEVGGFSAQPSEAAKLALALWMATVLARKGPLVRLAKHSVIPVLFPMTTIVAGLVVLGHDLGTTVIILCIVAAGLYFAGAPGKLFIGFTILGAVGALVMALTSGNRLSRLSGWLGNCDDGNDLCFQSQNGIYALASGGWWGVGLGQGRQKWNWIPEAHNDFIFAIIGEEFGLLGSLVVVLLYGVLAVAIFRVIVRHNDPFIRIVCGCIMTWIIGQAFVNIAMVTGLLPVIGVPLPLISYGGTALTLVLMGVGVVLSFARTSPASEKAAA